MGDIYNLILLFFAILPFILLLSYVYKKDNNKEPFKLLIILFLLGIASCFLVLLISFLLKLFLPFMDTTGRSSFIDVMLYAFLGVGLVEELCKWLMVYLFGYRSKYFDEIYDIIVYSIFVSLGFAFFENILYVLLNQKLTLAFTRGVFSIPGHACFALFMGYYLCIAKVCHIKGKNNSKTKNLILSIIVPSLLHGIFDFCLMSGYKLFMFSFIIFIVILFIISIKKINEMSDYSNILKSKNRFCKNCGALLNGQFCSECGTYQNK